METEKDFISLIDDRLKEANGDHDLAIEKIKIVIEVFKEQGLLTFWPGRSACDHDFTGLDNKGFTVCRKCGEQYT